MLSIVMSGFSNIFYFGRVCSILFAESSFVANVGCPGLLKFDSVPPLKTCII